MKITSLSAEVLEIKEGRGRTVLFGGLMVVIGLFIAVSMNAEPRAILVALGLILAGPYFMLASSSIRFNANRRNGQVLYQKKKLFGNKRSNYAIADVQQIVARQYGVRDTSTSDDGRTVSQTVMKCQPSIVFRDGRQAELFPGIEPSNALLPLANQVAQFLNVPIQHVSR